MKKSEEKAKKLFMCECMRECLMNASFQKKKKYIKHRLLNKYTMNLDQTTNRAELEK